VRGGKRPIVTLSYLSVIITRFRRTGAHVADESGSPTQRVRRAAEELVLEASRGKEEWDRACEIRLLVGDQVADDRSMISHAPGGRSSRTSTSRIGSAWVGSLPNGDTTLDSRTPWQQWDSDQDDLAQAMDLILSALTPDERDLLLLRYGHNTPLREIGEIVGCSKDTVSRMLELIRSRIRTDVETLADGPETYHDASAALRRWVQTLGGGGGA
jgi:RNA polymerase sigma factor (sigma-70 family)